MAEKIVKKRRRETQNPKRIQKKVVEEIRKIDHHFTFSSGEERVFEPGYGPTPTFR